MNKLRLDEALFDDDMKLSFDEPAIKVFDEGHFADYNIDEFDDNIFDYEPAAESAHDAENVPEGPAAGIPSGVADSLINLINDEWEAIQGYNTFREMILSMQKNGDADYTRMLSVIDEISNEENLHVGQLQELLKIVSPNTESIAKGEEEGKKQLTYNPEHEWVNGQLKVQMHQPIVVEASANDLANPNQVDTTCTLADADDEW